MIEKVVQSVIKNRKITLFLVGLIGIFGMYNYYITPKQQAPDISPPNALVMAVYPGASPEDIESLVTTKIEDKLTSVEGYDYTESFSRDNAAMVILFLVEGADTKTAYDDVRRKMQELQRDLPEGVQPLQVDTSMAETAGALFTIRGKNYTDQQLEAFAKDLSRTINRIKGVARTEIVGEQVQEIHVQVDLDQLKYYHVSLEDISNLLQAQNLEIPSGSLKSGDNQLYVKAKGLFTSLEDIGNVIIAVSPKNGSTARLKDVATIRQETKEDAYRIFAGHDPAMMVTAYFRDNENVVFVGQEMKSAIEKFRQTLPEDVTLEEVTFQPEDVNNLVKAFTLNLVEGIVLVVLVVLLGMGLRNAIVVSTAVPTSILSGFLLMGVLGIKIHQISIAALIIALGMLVDNAIVISDAIQKRLDRGEDSLEACISGVKEMYLPVLTSTLTTVVAFLPLLMLTSIAGSYIRSIPQILIITLSMSYLVAILVTPTLGYMVFRPSKGEGKAGRVRLFFDDLLKRAMSHRKITAVVLVILLGLTAGGAATLNLQFFPKENGNILYINIKEEDAVDIKKTQAAVQQTMDLLDQEKEVKTYTAAVGGSLPRFFIAMFSTPRSANQGQIMMRINLKEGGRFKTNAAYADYLQKLLDRRLLGAKASVRELEQAYPIVAPIVLRIMGNRVEEIQPYADKIQGIMEHTQGTRNVKSNLSPQGYEFQVDMKPEKAGSLGVTKYDLQREIANALRGKESSVLRTEGREYDIMVKGDSKTKEDLENLFVKSAATGELIPIREVADIHLARRVADTKRFENRTAITLSCDIAPSYNSVRVQGAIMDQIKKLEIRNVDLKWDGERERIVENFGAMGFSAILAVLLVFGVLLFEFGSFMQPLIILLSIPLSAVGSIAGLMLLRQPLSFMALFGIVSLLGIVVNNAIILIDCINVRRKEGHSIYEACETAVDLRFRPIMLTTVTTVIGLAPLTVSSNDLFRPMAISIMFGLMVSTLLTMVVIPTFYYTVETWFHKRVFRKLEKQDKVDL